jgi:hypothetical protein
MKLSRNFARLGLPECLQLAVGHGASRGLQPCSEVRWPHALPRHAAFESYLFEPPRLLLPFYHLHIVVSQPRFCASVHACTSVRITAHIHIRYHMNKCVTVEQTKIYRIRKKAPDNRKWRQHKQDEKPSALTLGYAFCSRKSHRHLLRLALRRSNNLTHLIQQPIYRHVRWN